jgi:hypothetical protein
MFRRNARVQVVRATRLGAAGVMRESKGGICAAPSILANLASMQDMTSRSGLRR